MKLASSTASPIDIRLTETVPTGAGGVGDRGGLRLLMSTAEGHIGLGETAPIPGVEGPSLETLAGEIAAWSNGSTGESVEELLADIDNHQLSCLARFAVHTALLDLIASASETPLSQYLRAGARSHVRVNALVAASNPGAVHNTVSQLVGDGVTAIKLKVGATSLTEDVTRIIAASEAAGTSVELRLDANRAWDRATTERVLGRVGMHRISYVEDPTPDSAEYGDITESTGVRTALDLGPDDNVESVLGSSGVSVLVVKPAAIGGIDRILDISRQRPELTLVVSGSIDREIALAAAIHAAAALPGDEAHGLSTGSIVRSMPEELCATNGVVAVPSSIGVFRPTDFSRTSEATS